jgi:hypothetical protein
MGLGVALAGLGALSKAVTGGFQGIKANNIDKNNIRPTEVVQNEYFQNVNDAEQAAKFGMPVAQYQRALQNIQRNQQGAIRTLGRSANPSAGLTSMLRASNDANLDLDVKNAQDQRQNQRFLIGQRGILANRKESAFDWNQRSKYLADFAKAQALRGAGAQNLMGAFGDAQQLGMFMDGGTTQAQQGTTMYGGNAPQPRTSMGIKGYQGGLRY